MLKESVGFLAHITGVETARKLYTLGSDPDQQSFIKSKIKRILYASTPPLTLPAATRIMTAESDIPLWNPNVGTKTFKLYTLKSWTYWAGAATDVILFPTMTFMLASQLHSELHSDFFLTFAATKLAINAATHLSLDGARFLLDKVKGSPIQIRV